jgi:hypothetical protein
MKNRTKASIHSFLILIWIAVFKGLNTLQQPEPFWVK